MKESVFVTGMSTVTPCGMDLEQTWQSIINGKTGIGPITQWPVDNLDYALAGEVKEYNPRTMLPDRKLLKVISRQDVLGINAAIKAVEHSGMIAHRDAAKDKEAFNDKTGVYVGSPGNKYCHQYDFLPLMAQSKDMGEFAQGLFDVVHPMWLLRILPNNVLAYTGITYGFKGPNHNVTNHAVSGMQALQEAYHAIQQGIADRVVVVAYELGHEPQAIINYGQLGLLSKSSLTPFDAEHDGTILAEGAAALVIESEASSLKRGADCHAEILPGFSTTEGDGLFSMQDDAYSLTELVKKTLDANHLSASDIGMITAHASGNPKSDITEALMIGSLFENTPVTGFKWATGHTIAASGLLDCLLTIKSLEKNKVPGIANLKTIAKKCQGLNVSNAEQQLKSAIALVINRGFSGMNSTMLFKACD
jgi:3-oxoacyl-[acyl-carrier-protein] synthase I